MLDFTDELNNHLREHAKQRRHFIKTTEGFGENIVANFPYKELGFGQMAKAA